jgi:hypothetical protein
MSSKTVLTLNQKLTYSCTGPINGGNGHLGHRQMKSRGTPKPVAHSGVDAKAEKALCAAVGDRRAQFFPKMKAPVSP